jgi:predicted esterase
MERNQVQFSINAPYFAIGQTRERTETIWMIFHGYGQLAEHFQARFSVIDPAHNRLVFPQALSRFYLKGVTKQVGASWMTAYERQTDIQNYITYLDQIYQLEVKPQNRKVHVIGFSQGAHTASRWIYHSKIPYQKFIAWGAGLADEVDRKTAKQSFAGENYVVIGDQDRFVTGEVLETMKLRYKAIGYNYKLISYQGTHDVYPEVLKALL